MREAYGWVCSIYSLYPENNSMVMGVYCGLLTGTS